MDIQGAQAAKDLTKIYFKIVFWTTCFAIVLLSTALFANFNGQLWFPGILFLVSITLHFVIAYSPPAMVFSGVAATYTLIPFVGDLSVSETATDLHNKIKTALDNLSTVLALIFLFLFVVYIDSYTFARQMTIALMFAMGFAILTWWVTKVTTKPIIWKVVFLTGILTLVKATALLYPMPIHDTFGIYPGVVVSKHEIAANVHKTAQRDALVVNRKNIKAIKDFNELLQKFPDKTSDEIITFVLTNYAKDSDEYKIADVEKQRRNGTATKKVYKKAAQVATSVKNYFADPPEPQVFKTVLYNPYEHGVQGMKISVPGNEPYTVRCSGSYRQTFHNGHQEYISCNGIFSRNMPDAGIRLMPIQDARQYGKVLIDAKIGHTSVNINVPQVDGIYQAISGYVSLEFIR